MRIFSEFGKLINKLSRHIGILTDENGAVEQDLQELWNKTIEAIKELNTGNSVSL